MMLSDVSRVIPSLLACASSILLVEGILVEYWQVIDRQAMPARDAQLVVLVVQQSAPQHFRIDPEVASAKAFLDADLPGTGRLVGVLALVLDVFSDHIEGCSASGENAIRTRPQDGFPIVSRQLRREFLAKLAGADGLERIHKPRRLDVRARIHEQVDVIRLTVHFDQNALCVIADAAEMLFQTIAHGVCQRRPPVFCHKNYVIKYPERAVRICV
jgi:hypothetical protein